MKFTSAREMAGEIGKSKSKNSEDNGGPFETFHYRSVCFLPHKSWNLKIGLGPDRD